jgi:hypothetical protein
VIRGAFKARTSQSPNWSVKTAGPGITSLPDQPIGPIDAPIVRAQSPDVAAEPRPQRAA